MSFHRLNVSIPIIRTKICSSKAHIQFKATHSQSKLVSRSFHVPEIDAVWWIEARPVAGYPTFASNDFPPEIRLIITVNEQELVESGVFYAKVNMKETSIDTNQNRFLEEYMIDINDDRVECDLSSMADDASEEQQLRNVYIEFDDVDNSEIWHTKDSFDFDVSISFEYDGEFDRVDYLLKKLLSTGQVCDLGAMLESEKFADFTFNVRGRQFKAHKIILSSASEAFDTMFSCGLEETKNNSANDDCDPKVFALFLRFIYTKVVPVDEMPKICIELYELAHRNGIELLEKICMVFIDEKKIDQDSALKLYEFAATYEKEEMLEKSWKFISFKMLGHQELCSPKPLDQVKKIFAKKRKFDQEIQSFFNGNGVPETPAEKKQRTRID